MGLPSTTAVLYGVNPHGKSAQICTYFTLNTYFAQNTYNRIPCAAIRSADQAVAKPRHIARKIHKNIPRKGLDNVPLKCYTKRIQFPSFSQESTVSELHNVQGLFCLWAFFLPSRPFRTEQKILLSCNKPLDKQVCLWYTVLVQ